MRYFLMIFVLFAVPAFGQDAKVLELKSQDAVKAKQLYDYLQQAQKSWDDFQSKVTKDYLQVPEGDPEAGSSSGYLDFSGATVGSCLKGSYNGELTWDDCGGETKTPKQAIDKREEKKALVIYRRRGWDSGFLFSSDFKFIVPKPNLDDNVHGSHTNGLNYNWGVTY